MVHFQRVGNGFSQPIAGARGNAKKVRGQIQMSPLGGPPPIGYRSPQVLPFPGHAPFCVQGGLKQRVLEISQILLAFSHGIQLCFVANDALAPERELESGFSLIGPVSGGIKGEGDLMGVTPDNR